VKLTNRPFVRTVLGSAAAVAVAGSAWSQGQPVKIGLLATLEGPFAAGGADGMRGAERRPSRR
jgi:branched-chain amino acid transport system substrate-binding protein